jgi:hypothetical protein
MGTRNGQWYNVKCSKPLFGQKIRLVTIQSTYLSISGFEAWTAAAPTTTTTEEVEEQEITISGPPKKITLENASMNKPYSASSFKAEYALEAGAKRTAIAAKGVGNWWKASFNGGDSVVEKVRIRNRHDCCGNRLTGTKITIGDQVCGTIPATGTGAWVEVKCAEPLMGGEIKLTTTRNDYLQINAVEPYGWVLSM